MISKAFAYSGYEVISVREFHSNIKGRHSYVHLRVKNEPVRSLKYPVDLLVALDPDTIFEHHEDVSKGTRELYDSDFENSELSQARMIMRDTSRRICKCLADYRRCGINTSSLRATDDNTEVYFFHSQLIAILLKYFL